MKIDAGQIDGSNHLTFADFDLKVENCFRVFQPYLPLKRRLHYSIIEGRTTISMLLLQGERILLTFSINITPWLLSSCHEMSLLLSVLLKEHISLLLHAKIWKCLCLNHMIKYMTLSLF